MVRASKLTGTARDRAFARIDLAMTSQASPWAVFEQPADPAMFSDTLPEKTYSSADEVFSALGWETAPAAPAAASPSK